MADEPERKPSNWRRRAIGLAAGSLLLIALQSQAFSQEEVPLLNQPAANFYQARGSSVKVAWIVEPKVVAEDGELVATLVISGAANPLQIVRPDLKKIEDFQSRFVIGNQADLPAGKDAAEVRFSYRLRPRHRAVDRVPELEFYYYNPSAAAGKSQFPKAIARRVPISVTEAPRVEPPAIPLTESEQLFELATGPALLERHSQASDYWPWLAAALVGPFIAVIWFLAWQRVFPDAARQSRIRRGRAARRAVDAIRRADRAVDPPAAMAAAMLNYLRARFPLPPGADTPGEIEAALVQQHVPDSECSAVGRYFRACDAARFAPSGEAGMSLAGEAEALVSRLEGA